LIRWQCTAIGQQNRDTVYNGIGCGLNALDIQVVLTQWQNGVVDSHDDIGICIRGKYGYFGARDSLDIGGGIACGGGGSKRERDARLACANGTEIQHGDGMTLCACIDTHGGRNGNTVVGRCCGGDCDRGFSLDYLDIFFCVFHDLAFLD